MKINGKFIYLKKISINDSKFIYNLRNTKRISQFLNNPPKSLIDQRNWVKNNIKDFETLDFIIYDKSKNKKIGTIGFNDINKKKYIAEWGRWICLGTAIQNIESAIILISFGFKQLRLKKIYSLTNSKNKKVINFHKKTGSKYLGIVKNKYIISGKKTSATKFQFNQKNFKLFKNLFTSMIQ